MFSAELTRIVFQEPALSKCDWRITSPFPKGGLRGISGRLSCGQRREIPPGFSLEKGGTTVLPVHAPCAVLARPKPAVRNEYHFVV